MGRGDGIGKTFFPQQNPCHPGIDTQFGRPDSSDRARKDQKSFLGISQYLAVPGIAVSGICTLQSYEHLGWEKQTSELGEQRLWETG